MSDKINPDHYRKGGIEVIDVIERYAKTDFRLANVLKYVCRCEYKGQKLEDLKKAQWYLNRAVADEEARIECERLEAEFAIEEAVDRLHEAFHDTLRDLEDGPGFKEQVEAFGAKVGSMPPEIREMSGVPPAVDPDWHPRMAAADPDNEAEPAEGDAMHVLPNHSRKMIPYEDEKVVAVCDQTGKEIRRGDSYLTANGKTFCSPDALQAWLVAGDSE